jgi:hypothetical protein
MNQHLIPDGIRDRSNRRGAGRLATVPAPWLVRGLLFLFQAGFVTRTATATEPTAKPARSQGSAATVDSTVETWQLERNPVAQPLVRARPITAADRPVPNIPPCGFERPVFWEGDDGIVVDATAFSDLRTVQGRRASAAGAAGSLVGRVVHDGQDARLVVKLLVHAGVIDAGIHAATTVTLVAAGRDGDGEWFRLASDARYWTNREHHEPFTFGVRVSAAGEVRVLDARALPE